MDGATIGWIGGIFGSVVGIMGGVLGTYLSIKSAKGPIERAFIKRSAIIAWVTVSVFLGLLFALPEPYNYLMWIPYAVTMLIGVPKLRKKHTEIRRSESGGETFTSHL